MSNQELSLVGAACAGYVASQVYRRVEPDGLQAVLHGAAFVAVSFVCSRQTGASVLHLLLVFVASLFASILFYRAVRRGHPLGHLPGPLLARLTQFVSANEARKGTQHLWLQKLHEQYGEVVRIGPNSVSVLDPHNVRKVMSLPKHAYFWQIGSSETGLFRSPQNNLHRQIRLVWQQAFTSNALTGYLPMLRKRNKDLLKAVARHGSEPFNLRRPVSDATFNVAVDLGFGDGRPAEELEEDSEYVQEAFESHNRMRHWAGQVPWIGPLLGLFLLYVWPLRWNGSLRFGLFARKAFAARQKKEPPFKDVFHWLLSKVDNLTPGDTQKTFSFTERQLIGEATLVIAAGSDTSSITLGTLLYELLARPECIDRLRAELEHAFPDVTVPDTDEYIDTLLQLPYLDACVQEGLRLAGIDPSGGPRTVQEDGLVLIDGTSLPAGTRVQVPFYVSHLHEKWFSPHPTAFFPERWLEPDSEKWNTSKEAWHPFSLGPRSCIGQGLANRELRLFLSSLVLSFDFEFAPGFDAKGFKDTYRDFYLLQFGELRVVAKTRRELSK